MEKRPSILKRIFSILTSERHLKTLQDKENASYVGASIDELVRHHPSLKAPVFEAIEETLQRVEDLGNAFTISAADAVSYQLLLVPSPEAKDGEDHPMEVVEPFVPQAPAGPTDVSQVELVANIQANTNILASANDGALPSDEADFQPSDGSKNLILSYIHVIGRVSRSPPTLRTYTNPPST